MAIISAWEKNDFVTYDYSPQINKTDQSIRFTFQLEAPDLKKAFIDMNDPGTDTEVLFYQLFAQGLASQPASVILGRLYQTALLVESAAAQNLNVTGTLVPKEG